MDLCKEAGADIVKFQHYSPIDVLGLDHPALDEAIQCQFTKKEHEILAHHATLLDVEYLVSVFSVNDITWADGLVKRHKVASRMNRNLEFLAKMEQTKKPVIMSIQDNTPLRQLYRDRFYFMWCVTNYPASEKEVLDYPFSYKYGLSSHCPKMEPTVEAYRRGARIFENHICESRTEVGCDMSSSITIDSFGKMVKQINDLHSALETK